MDWGTQMARLLGRTIKLGVPTNIGRVVDKLQCEVFSEHMHSDACYMVIEGHKCIFVNRRHREGSPFWRSLVAHECGHALTLPPRQRGAVFSNDRDITTPRYEWYARCFAFELLMPFEQVRDLSLQNLSAYDMADYFDVLPSFAAARIFQVIAADSSLIGPKLQRGRYEGHKCLPESDIEEGWRDGQGDFTFGQKCQHYRL